MWTARWLAHTVPPSPPPHGWAPPPLRPPCPLQRPLFSEGHPWEPPAARSDQPESTQQEPSLSDPETTRCLLSAANKNLLGFMSLRPLSVCPWNLPEGTRHTGLASESSPASLEAPGNRQSQLRCSETRQDVGRQDGSWVSQRKGHHLFSPRVWGSYGPQVGTGLTWGQSCLGHQPALKVKGATHIITLAEMKVGHGDVSHLPPSLPWGEDPSQSLEGRVTGPVMGSPGPWHMRSLLPGFGAHEAWPPLYGVSEEEKSILDCLLAPVYQPSPGYWLWAYTRSPTKESLLCCHMQEKRGALLNESGPRTAGEGERWGPGPSQKAPGTESGQLLETLGLCVSSTFLSRFTR